MLSLCPATRLTSDLLTPTAEATKRTSSALASPSRGAAANRTRTTLWASTETTALVEEPGTYTVGPGKD